MNNFSNSIFLFLSLILCSTKTETSATEVKGLELNFKETIRISVDKETYLGSCLINLSHDLESGKDFLSIFNPQNLVYTEYDFKENQIVKNFLIEESSKLGNYSGLRMKRLSYDSILFFNNESSMVTLINSEGKTILQEKLPNENYGIQYLNYNWSLFEFHQNRLYLNARRIDDYFAGNQSFSVISYDVGNKQIDPVNIIPKVLNEKYFGLESIILSYSSAYNVNDNIFYHSFGVTPYVIEQGGNNRELPIISFSHKDPIAIGDLNKEELLQKFSYNQVYEMTLKNPRYPAIRFDAINKFLLRDFLRPSSDDEILNNSLANPSIIIANLDGVVLGQFSLDRNSYIPGTIFFVENGLVLVNQKAYDEDSDDYFHFDLFEYVSTKGF